MRRTATGIIIVLGLVLAACGSATTTPLAQPAGTEGETMINTISVSGTGEVTGTPDTLIVDLGVAVLRSGVDQATTDAAALATAVIDAVKAMGVEERDIQTTNYAIWPEYDYGNNTQTLRGYRVTNTISIKIRDLDKAGATIDAATAAGGDDAVVNGIRFDMEENGALITAAREAAWNDAKGKAEQLASLAGVGLGQAVSITESTSSNPPPIFYREMAAADAAGATPIQPGEQVVSVTVNVSFAIEG
jgi:uncharacterized protein YggE